VLRALRVEDDEGLVPWQVNEALWIVMPQMAVPFSAPTARRTAR
jgi:hypothetical protein